MLTNHCPHAGHVRLLERAKAEGTYLIVGIHSDADVAAYKRVPVMTLQERADVVRALRCVDEVVMGSPVKITAEFIKKHRIDKHVHAHSPEEVRRRVALRVGVLCCRPP